MSDEEEEDEYGLHFGKFDLDRVGFFDFTTASPFDEYRTVIQKGEVRHDVIKGKRLLCIRHGDLFDKEVKRLFVGEALPELGRIPKKWRKMKLGIIRSGGTPKIHSTPGDWFGCIGKQPPAFSPKLKESLEKSEPYQKGLPNFLTKQIPRGGPGYLNITINPYIPVRCGPDPYQKEILRKKEDKSKPRRFVSTCAPIPYFTENPYNQFPLPPLPEVEIQEPPHRKLFKLTFPRAPYGKNHGCFSKFPTYLSDPYEKKLPHKHKHKSLPGLSASTPQTRSKYTVSIIDRVTNVALNANNFAEYREQVYPLS